ncbi:NAD(P)H-dependent oxidoreductase [Chryseobacterium jejuense]|uniref:NAD(P)H-dependent oxidoreductase n=1 Tax=Chryseobacterium jejuense TaxID=445960 RepID=UPI0037447C1D
MYNDGARICLANYDRFVFQFPLIWFGMPPLLRLWMMKFSIVTGFSPENITHLKIRKFIF